MHHFEQPARRRVVRKSVECCDFCWISGPQVKLAFQRHWNSRKQSETAGSGPAWSCQNCQSAAKNLSAQSHFFLKSATGNSWKQLGLVPLIARKVFCLQKKCGLTILAWSRRAAPDGFRLFPTVSVSLEGQFHLWTTDSAKITTFNAFPHDPSARRLLEMMHFDFETQYTLKIPNPQDLVKFNSLHYVIHIIRYIYIYM